MKRHKILLATLLLGGVLALSPRPASAQQPYYLYDRGDGIPTSLLGTYVRKGELLAYSFYEYTRDSTNEYKPSEMGFKGPRAGEDFFGKLEQHEFLLFFAYGFTDWLAVEFESAVYTTATLKKAKSDPSTMPKKLREDGLGDTEMQIRLRWLKEGDYWPEGVFFFETVFPLQSDKKLIGTQDWELSPGLVFTKGFGPFGTLAFRFAFTYSAKGGDFEFGEYAIEYLKRLSPNWLVALAFEGEQDEQSIIGEVQYSLSKNIALKVNCGFGVTKKAPDFAPEIGLLFRF